MSAFSINHLTPVKYCRDRVFVELGLFRHGQEADDFLPVPARAEDVTPQGEARRPELAEARACSPGCPSEGKSLTLFSGIGHHSAPATLGAVINSDASKISMVY